MAQRGNKDLLARLADAGEEALTRFATSPGMDRVTGVMTNMKAQVDALTNKVRGMDALEKRLDDLERKVDRLSKPSGSGAARKTTTTRKTSSARKTSSPRKTSSSRKKT